jgi:uncharacterized protein (TIRG00374 family)
MDGSSKIRSIYRWLIRIVGTGLFSWLVLRNGDPWVIIKQVAEIDLFMYVLLCGVFLFQHYLLALRWQVLLRAVNLTSPVMELFRIILYGQGLNKVLPSSIGGDSAKVAYILINNPEDKAQAVSATLIDRLVGLFVLCFIVLFTLPFVDNLPSTPKMGGMAIFGLVVIFVLLIYVGFLDGLIDKILQWSIFSSKLGKQLVKLWNIFKEYRQYPQAMIKAFLLSLLIKIIMIVSQFYTFLSIGVEVPILDMFFSIPLVNLVTTIPISIGGIGVREASLTALLNIPAELVVSYSLIRYSISIVVILLVFLVSFLKLGTSREKSL